MFFSKAKKQKDINFCIYFALQNICKSNTLSDGYPYYYKYGFKYKNKIDHLNVKTNYINLKNIQTANININDIFDIIKLQMTHNSKYYIDNKIEENIRRLYDKYQTKNIKKFIKSIKYELCYVFSMIYMSLYAYLNLINYTSKIMIYKIVK